MNLFRSVVLLSLFHSRSAFGIQLQIVNFKPSEDLKNPKLRETQTRLFAEKLQTFLNQRNLNLKFENLPDFLAIKNEFRSIASEIKDFNHSAADAVEQQARLRLKVEVFVEFLWLAMGEDNLIEQFLAPHHCEESVENSVLFSSQKDPLTIIEYFDSKRAHAKLLPFFQKIESRAALNLNELPNSFVEHEDQQVFYARSIITLFDSYPRLYRIFANYYRKKVAHQVKKFDNMTCTVSEMAQFFTYAGRLYSALRMDTSAFSTEQMIERRKFASNIYSHKLEWTKTMNEIFRKNTYLELWDKLLIIQDYLEVNLNSLLMIKVFQVLMFFNTKINHSWFELEKINIKLQQIEKSFRSDILGLEQRKEDLKTSPMADFSEWYASSSIAKSIAILAVLMSFF